MSLEWWLGSSSLKLIYFPLSPNGDNPISSWVISIVIMMKTMIVVVVTVKFELASFLVLEMLRGG